MNTGIQKSGLTPYGALTTTTPLGKEAYKKENPLIITQHKVPYVATTRAQQLKNYGCFDTKWICRAYEEHIPIFVNV